jgi:hypothetical protein
MKSLVLGSPFSVSKQTMTLGPSAFFRSNGDNASSTGLFGSSTDRRLITILSVLSPSNTESLGGAAGGVAGMEISFNLNDPLLAGRMEDPALSLSPDSAGRFSFDLSPVGLAEDGDFRWLDAPEGEGLQLSLHGIDVSNDEIPEEISGESENPESVEDGEVPVENPEPSSGEES